METRNSPNYKESNVASKTVLAVFDFDGTITTRDTFIDFSRFSVGLPTLLLKIIVSSPSILWRIIKTRSLSEGKEILFKKIFKDFEENDFLRKGRRYAEERLPRLIRPEAVQKINWHKTQGHTLVILSASLSPWIEPWAKENNFPCIIATEPEIKNGRLTGKFRTKNCVGEEKKKRLLEIFPNAKQYTIYGYGNSKNDRPFLTLADHPFYKRF